MKKQSNTMPNGEPKKTAWIRNPTSTNQAVITKYHAATDRSGARISARCKGGSVMVNCGDLDNTGVYNPARHAEVARRLIDKLNWGGEWSHGTLPDGRHVFTHIMEE